MPNLVNPETPRSRIDICAELIKVICTAGNHAFLPTAVLIPLNALTESYEEALAASQQEVERLKCRHSDAWEEIAKLRASLALAQKDTARLDWLDNGEGKFTRLRKLHDALLEVSTVREALDAASPPPETTQGETR